MNTDTQTHSTELSLEQLNDVNGGALPALFWIGSGIATGVAAGIRYFAEDIGDAIGSTDNVAEDMGEGRRQRQVAATK